MPNAEATESLRKLMAANPDLTVADVERNPETGLYELKKPPVSERPNL